MKTLTFIKTANTDPFHNLALETYLLHHVRSGECILYLWQNERTVVIGKNQNAASECRIQALEADGGHLTRRLSGGGAVYHDLGNLNFTFLAHDANYDVDKQTEVILRAVQKCGIHAEKNGRNDLTVDGLKFSGHSYYHTGGRSFHNGTIMLDVDTEPLAKYLNVSPLKLKSKGVASVRSRVCNLSDFTSDLTLTQLSDALLSAFSEVYDLPVKEISEDDLDVGAIAEWQEFFASDGWRYGDNPILDCSKEEKYEWGLVRIDYSTENGVIKEAALWSDGLDADYLEKIPELLKGVPLERKPIVRALSRDADAKREIAEDIAALLTQDRLA